MMKLRLLELKLLPLKVIFSSLWLVPSLLVPISSCPSLAVVDGGKYRYFCSYNLYHSDMALDGQMDSSCFYSWEKIYIVLRVVLGLQREPLVGTSGLVPELFCVWQSERCLGLPSVWHECKDSPIGNTWHQTYSSDGCTSICHQICRMGTSCRVWMDAQTDSCCH